MASNHLGVVLYDPTKIKGWPADDGTEDGLEKQPLVPLMEALTHRFDVDAHFQPVWVEGESGTQYRVRKGVMGTGSQAYLTAVFVDYDLPDGHRLWKDNAEEATVCAALLESTKRANLPTPGVYSTMRGARLVWPLATPIRAEVADAWLAAFRDHIKGQVGATPLIMDDAAKDWGRVYRLPDVKREGKYWTPYYKRLHGMEPLHWDPGVDLDEASVYATRPSDDMPEIRELSEKEWLHIPASFRPLLQSKEPLFTDGNRNNGTLTQLLPKISGTISNWGRPDPIIVFRAMAPGVIAQGREPTLERLWHMCYVICTNDAEDFDFGKAVGQVVEQETYEAIDEAARLTRRAEDADATKTDRKAAEAARRRAARAKKKLDDARDKAKAQAQLSQSTSTANTNPRRPWLIYTGHSRYAFVLYADGRYYPKPKDTIAVFLERQHNQRFRTDKGALLKFPEMFDAIGADAHECRMRYWLPGRSEHYDPSRRLLLKTTPPPGRSFNPVYHDMIDEWLRALCTTDADYDRLIDWLAAFFQLERPVCALFMYGPAKVGKTMLAEALGMIWGEKGDYNTVVGNNFQHSMAKSPVLASDDGMKLTNDKAAEAFKELVTRRRHEVNVKYEVPFSMEGCARVVLNGNSLSDISLPTGNVYHNEALMERLFVLRCSVKARDLLEQIDTENPSWVGSPNSGPGLLAEHILWLNDNHEQITPRGRLLVSGDMDSDWMSHKAASSTSLDGAVLQALAKWADESMTYQGIGVLPDKHPGAIIVNSGMLRQHWLELTGDSRTPHGPSLNQVISTLSVWEKSRPVRLSPNAKRLRCHAIPIEAVLEAAEQAGVGDHEEMLKKLCGEDALTNAGNRPV